MSSKLFDKIYKQASAWAEQLKTNPSFTNSDVEELKSHLIDLAEELCVKGLNQEEAFMVASSRLNMDSTLKEEFEAVNLPIIQLRKIILVLSGILLFFLLYFFTVSSTRLLVLVLHGFMDDPYLLIWQIIMYVIDYQFSFIFFAIFFYFSDEKMIKGIEMLKIKPRHTYLLFSAILILAIADQCFRQLINEVFKMGSYTTGQLHAIFDYLTYSYPFIIVICFVVFFNKYYLSKAYNGSDSALLPELPSIPEVHLQELKAGIARDEQLKKQLDDHLKDLEKIPLNKTEALGVARMRMKMIPLQNYHVTSNLGNSMWKLMAILSGVLVYFFFHFLMLSSARVLFFVLQHFVNDPILNIRRTWLFVISFQWVFIFFTAGLYFLDKNIVHRLNRIHIKPVHTRLLLYVTIFLAIVDRYFSPLAKNAIGRNHINLIYKFLDIFIVSEYTFPFVLGACFLILFYKYYRDNVRIGN